MTLLATTELEAVNEMLAAMSEAPVTSLTDDTIDDALIAKATLRKVSKEVQSAGWHFNTDYDYPLQVNAELKIAYPATAAHVDAMDTEYKDLVKRGNFMYDRENRTFFFSAGTVIKCKIKWLLDFEDLPESFRTYITMKAANRFVAQQLGDEGAVQYSKFELDEAMAEAKADEMRRADLNILRSSNSARRILSRRTQWRG